MQSALSNLSGKNPGDSEMINHSQDVKSAGTGWTLRLSGLQTTWFQTLAPFSLDPDNSVFFLLRLKVQGLAKDLWRVQGLLSNCHSAVEPQLPRDAV